MNSLGDVPDIALQKLFEYLPVHDVLNLRLTCSRIFKIRDFMKELKSA